MAVSTTDIVTSSDASKDDITNGNAIVHCTKGGTVQKLTTYSHSTATFAEIEAKYTNRLDEVAYYNTPSGISGGSA